MARPDALRELLQCADAAAPPLAPLPGDLAARVHRRVLRHRRLRHLALGSLTAAAAVVVLSLGGLFWGRRPPVEPGNAPPPAAANAANWRADLAVLEAAAAAHTQAAKLITAAAHARRVLATAARPTRVPAPPHRARAEVEQAAQPLVEHGAELERELKSPQPAVNVFREVVRLFPNTAWAAVARDKLATIEKQNGGAS